MIAVDDTLGSFSAYEGRIYVAYVDRSKAASNPADNTDIELDYSTNDGATWYDYGVVNDDNGQVDGHTERDGRHPGAARSTSRRSPSTTRPARWSCRGSTSATTRRSTATPTT